MELEPPDSLASILCPQPAAPPTSELQHAPLPNSLLFADGFFQSADVASPIVCMKLEEAMLSYGLFLQHRLQRFFQEEKGFFALMNGAFQGTGAFLYIPPNTRVEAPIEIHQLCASKKMASPRLQIFLGKNASAQIVHRVASERDAMSNVYLDVNLDAGANLFFGDAHTQADQSMHFLSLRSSLKRDSRFSYLSVSNGAKRSQASIKVQLLEENCEAKLLGLAQLSSDLQHHIDSTMEHIAPHTRSRQHFKTILKDQSRSCFEGKIIVRPEAIKTESYQLNNHLLLSSEALSHAKPNLEIFADDVKASHGATVSQFNEEELFYLSSRGFPLEMAQEMLIAGFCAEILSAIPLGIRL